MTHPGGISPRRRRSRIASTAKNLAVSCLAAMIHFSGAAILRRRLTRSKIPILAYHSVSAPEGETPSCLDLTGMRVTPREFRRQMEYVARHYHTVTLGDVLRSRSGEAPLPPHPCVITFDDGYLDAYENAVPVLEELGLRATFFVIGRPTASRELPWLHAMYEILDSVSAARCASAFHKAAPSFSTREGVTKQELCQQVRRYFDEQDRSTRARFLYDVRAELGNRVRRTFRFLKASQIRDLSERGFEIGCHSMEHEYLVRMSDEELLTDIRQCKDVLRRILRRPPDAFCYPFGWDFDGRVIETLRREGFVCASTTIPGLNDQSTHPFALHRIGVNTATSFPLFVFGLLGLEAPLRRSYEFLESAFKSDLRKIAVRVEPPMESRGSVSSDRIDGAPRGRAR